MAAMMGFALTSGQTYPSYTAKADAARGKVSRTACLFHRPKLGVQRNCQACLSVSCVVVSTNKQHSTTQHQFRDFCPMGYFPSGSS